MAVEPNGNKVKPNLLGVGHRPHGSSNEDLSEYTDADESVSAPTEFLSEFLSSLMLKDYTTALKYCKLILHYEPNNATAKEFYPLIIEKLSKVISEDELSNGPNTSSDDDPEPHSSHSDSETDSEDEDEENSESDKDLEQISLEQSLEENLNGMDSSTGMDNSVEMDNSVGLDKLPEIDNNSSKSLSPRMDSDGTTNSYSSLEDEEVARDDNILEEVVVHNSLIDDTNGNTIYPTSIVSTDGIDTSFNWFTKRKDKNKNTMEGNSTIFQMSSDSESPTDPVTQQTVEMLRMKFIQATN